MLTRLFTMQLALVAGVSLICATSNAFVVPDPYRVVLNHRQIALQAADNDAEDDDAPHPDVQEREKIQKVMRTMVADEPPIKERLGLHIIFSFFLELTSGKNKAVYNVLSLLRNGIPAQYMHLDEVAFSDNVRPILFYETIKKPRFVGLLSVIGMKYLSYMEEESGEIDYEALYGDKFLPWGRMMLSDDAEDCFTSQLSPFCKQESGSGRLVCDLDYLQKYEVKRGTPMRYGGVAYVEKGKIVEISGHTRSSPEFEENLARFLSSFAVHLIVDRHAVMTHLAISQRLLIKLTAKRSEDYQMAWKNDAGADLLLRALTTRTNEVSINEQLLIGPNRSLVGRATSLTDFSLVQLGSDMYEKYAAMSADDLIKDVADEGHGKWPVAAYSAWENSKTCANTICKNIVGKNGVTQDDVTNVALMLWVSTFYHGFIGDFQLDNVNKGNLPLLLTGKKHVQSYSYGTLSTTIGVSTLTRTINIATLGGLFEEQWQRSAWEDYMETLQELDIGVENFSHAGPVYAAVNF
jgi:hypothetical protein